jgi:DNA-binding transcriptional LysR family regulator
MATLDITALRTFVAVVAFSGVRRAAEALHLSPAAVSGHLRKLERELGCRLVIAQGRGIGLTSDGEELAIRARVILQDHDDAVMALRGPQPDELLVAATEHAAEFLVPAVVSTLTTVYPDHRIRLRLTRSARVRQLADDARTDIALMLNQPSHDGVPVASLPLQWFGTDQAPHDRIVLFARPCAVRNQAIAALGKRRHRIAKECSDLTSVLTASRNDLGVTPLPRIGPPPDGLRRIASLPAIPDVALYMAASDRIDDHAQATVIRAVHRALTSAYR